MTFKIFIPPNSLTSYEIENLFKAKTKRYVDLIVFEYSSEYKRLDNYFRTNYNESLYNLLLKTIEYSTVNKNDNYCLLNFLNHSLADKLTTESFIKLLLNGNLSLKKTYLIQNMVCYGFKDM